MGSLKVAFIDSIENHFDKNYFAPHYKNNNYSYNPYSFIGMYAIYRKQYKLINKIIRFSFFKTPFYQHEFRTGLSTKMMKAQVNFDYFNNFK